MLIIGVYCGFGRFDVFLGLGFDIEGFVFCWRWFFELFLGLRGALKLFFCIVVSPYFMTFCETYVASD